MFLIRAHRGSSAQGTEYKAHDNVVGDPDPADSERHLAKTYAQVEIDGIPGTSLSANRIGIKADDTATIANNLAIGVEAGHDNQVGERAAQAASFPSA